MKQENENCLDEKNSKMMKRSHSYKRYPSSHSVEILDSLNPELQLKDN